MSTITSNTAIIEKSGKAEPVCYHCGTPCLTDSISIEERFFCCEGCRLVYEIINSNGLCDYYTLQSHPGLSQVKPLRNSKYAYLDNIDIAGTLYDFSDGKHAIVTLYIPAVHCSSCMWLLEHMYKLDAGITRSRLNFTSKEVTVHFLQEKISLRKIVELLTTLGYEPYISLDDTAKDDEKKISRTRIYKLGVAGFCFGNIMMMSFPEYLSGDTYIGDEYARLFRLLNLTLSLPVLFYSASEFFLTAWQGVKQRVLNIDAPVALAILITFGRSLYEIISATGSGYLDSMSGIVFFMLVGRVAQERTYRSISFHRDYKAYFPIAVNVLTGGKIIGKKLSDLREQDIVRIYNGEIIPADAEVIAGNAHVDYSFVTGESNPVIIAKGNIVYAGGKQEGEQIDIRVVKPVAGSYLTSLWNHYAFKKNKTESNRRESIIHTLSKYFTVILFLLAGITALYWGINDPSRILPAVSAMLIVACPCALLLSATYTNGNLLRIFSNNGLYLRDASVIEQLGKIDHIVFDKTGTLTTGDMHLKNTDYRLTDEEKDILYTVSSSSKHPYSKALTRFLGTRNKIHLDAWAEIPGKGIEARAGNTKIYIGSASFVGVPANTGSPANMYIRIADTITGWFLLPGFRDSIQQIIPELRERYKLSLLSGDNNKQQPALRELFGDKSSLLFGQKPADKLQFVESLQQSGIKVAMIGDGLNDAGALQQSNVGITLADDINNFTPSCDAVLDASEFRRLPKLMKLAKSAAGIINTSFAVSIIYNIIGLSISMQGSMKPVIAAVLMPLSTLSIVLITSGVSSLRARQLGLSLKSNI